MSTCWIHGGLDVYTIIFDTGTNLMNWIMKISNFKENDIFRNIYEVSLCLIYLDAIGINEGSTLITNTKNQHKQMILYRCGHKVDELLQLKPHGLST